MANDLVVQLGAKLDQFAADMNKAGDLADSAVSRIEGTFANLNPGIGLSGLGGIATGAVASIGVLLGALQHVNSELADISKNAEFVGVTVERFQQLQFAATQGGIGSDQAVKDLRNVASLLADAKENTNSLTKLLEANNIKYKDQNGIIVSTNQLLAIAGGLINRFSSMPEKVKAAEALGLSEKWVAALHNGIKSFNDIADSADAAGAVIDRSTIAKAEAFDIAWKKSTALLASQFKAVTGDIAGALDDLIDKAAAFLTSFNAARGVGEGSGQAKFNAIADALDVARKDAQGLDQDLGQVTRVLERYKQLVSADPAVVAGLEEVRAKAAAIANEAERASRALSAASFPSGVPLPAGRPSSANDPAENAAKLASRTKDVRDQFDRAQDTIAKHTARLEADAQAAGKGASAQEELRAKAQLLTAAQAAGIPVIGETAQKIEDLSKKAGVAAEALAKAKVASDIEFGRGSAFLTQEDVQIAERLKAIYGNDIPAALASSQAAAIRMNDSTRQLAQTFSTSLTTGIVDVIDGTKSAADAFKDFSKVVLRALEEAIVKLLIIGPLMRSLQGTFGGFGGLGGLFGGSGATDGIGGFGPTAPPGFASGTNSAPGGMAWVGENGPELVNLPKGSQVIPSDVAMKGGGGGVVVNLIEDSSRAGQTQKQDNGSGGFDLTIFVDSITAKNAANPGSATSAALNQRGRVASR